MASGERVRVEIAFDGGNGIAALVPSEELDELERALAGGRGETLVLEADDARYVVVLRHVLYVKRFARESRVGFGAGE